MTEAVTVAIPVRNGGPMLEQVLRAVRAQRLDRELELIICDSGSRDGSPDVARRYADRLIEIEPAQFSHGGTRNLLMEHSAGSHVAFLTQDAIPADTTWLATLLTGFQCAPDVGLVFGPYRPRADASPMVTRELIAWFDGFSAPDQPRVDRLDPDRRDVPTRTLMGPVGFFTDANGCVARHAWRQVPFRDAAYAEDHLLAHDMLRAGYAKVFLPRAAVIHSHEYSPWGWTRRSFDEARALGDVYGWVDTADPRVVVRNVWGRVGADLRWAREHRRGTGFAATLELLVESTVHHLARVTGTLLGGRAASLPDGVVQRLSLERRVG